MLTQAARISRVAKILAFLFLIVIVFLLSGQSAGAGPGPFTPTAIVTLDDVAPGDPFVIPADDDCAVGSTCKHHYRVVIPDGQPGWILGDGDVLMPAAYLSLAGDAIVPDGAIIARNFGSWRTGPIGSCASSSTIATWDYFLLDATTNPATTTGSLSDLSSYSHWPTQLDSVRDAMLSAEPGSVLHARWVARTFDQNILIILLTDGSLRLRVFGGDPAVAPIGELCGPVDLNFVGLGVSMDNPDTGSDESGFPLFTCTSPGTQSYVSVFDRNDTPPGDPISVFDTATCSHNTPTGTQVTVQLLGGTDSLSGIDVTFDSVTTEGSTSVAGSTSGPPPPTGFEVVGLSAESYYYDLGTTAAVSGPIAICVQYDDTGLSPAQEASVLLMQNVDGSFVDRTTSLDSVANIVCGEASSFSIWAVVTLQEPPPTPTATPSSTPTITPTATVTPTPPPAVGGIALDAELRALPAAASQSSESGSGTLVAGAALVGLTSLAGAAWWARRRFL